MKKTKTKTKKEPEDKKLIVILIILILAIPAFIYIWQSVNQKQTYNQKQAGLKNNLAESKQTGKEEATPKVEMYKDFINKATKLSKANEYDYSCNRYSQNEVTLSEPDRTNCLKEKIKETDISEIHYIKPNDTIIALVPGEYAGGGFKLLKYNVKSGELEVAKREDANGGQETSWFKIRDKELDDSPDDKKDFYLWFATPQEITVPNYGYGKITLTGSSGDMGCWVRNDFDYDIEQNYITITKQCSGCENEKEKCVEF